MELTHDFYYVSARVCIKMTVGYINTNFMTVERSFCTCHVYFQYSFKLSPASIESKVKTYLFKVAFKTL